MRYAMLDHLILAAIERSGDCPQHDRQVGQACGTEAALFVLSELVAA